MMRRLIFCAVVSMAGLPAFANDLPGQHTPDGESSQLVISLDFQGSRLKRIDSSPTLSIYADGRVVMPKIYQHMTAYEGKISQAELQSLIDTVVDKNKFFQYDEAEVASKVARLTGPAHTLPVHLATTEIQVNLGNQSKTVRYYGLGNQRTVAETEKLLAIQTRLEQVMSVMKLGGADAANKWLALANRELRADDSKAELLSLADLRSTAIHTDGSAYVRFARVSPENKKSVSVSISMGGSGESNVTVVKNDLLSRPLNEVH